MTHQAVYACLTVYQPDQIDLALQYVYDHVGKQGCAHFVLACLRFRQVTFPNLEQIARVKLALVGEDFHSLLTQIGNDGE